MQFVSGPPVADDDSLGSVEVILEEYARSYHLIGMKVIEVRRFMLAIYRAYPRDENEHEPSQKFMEEFHKMCEKLCKIFSKPNTFLSSSSSYDPLLAVPNVVDLLIAARTEDMLKTVCMVHLVRFNSPDIDPELLTTLAHAVLRQSLVVISMVLIHASHIIAETMKLMAQLGKSGKGDETHYWGALIGIYREYLALSAKGTHADAMAIYGIIGKYIAATRHYIGDELPIPLMCLLLNADPSNYGKNAQECRKILIKYFLRNNKKLINERKRRVNQRIVELFDMILPAISQSLFNKAELSDAAIHNRLLTEVSSILRAILYSTNCEKKGSFIFILT